MNTSPARRPGSIRTGTSNDPRRDVTRTISPSARARRSASEGETSIDSPRRSGEVYPLVCTPVLYESSLLPVVSRSGNSSVSSSTGGSNGVTLNGAAGPRSSGSSSPSLAWRNFVPGWSSDGHGHWIPPSASRRFHDMPACIGESVRSSSHASNGVRSPQSWPRRFASWAMIHTSSFAWPGGASALRTRCTRRSLFVTVPSDSNAEFAAGSTTSAISAVLDVVLPAQRVEAAPVPPHVAGQQPQVDQREDVVDRVVVLGDAERPTDHRAIGLRVGMSELADRVGRDPGHLLAALERPIHHRVAVRVDALGAALDERGVVEVVHDDLARDRVRERDVRTHVDAQPQVGPFCRGRAAR